MKISEFWFKFQDVSIGSDYGLAPVRCQAIIRRGPEATSKLFTPESEVDILENLIGRTLRLISQK